MFDTFSRERTDIKVCYQIKEYEESIKKCEELLYQSDLSKTEMEEDSYKFNLWFAYQYLAKNYRQLFEYRKSIKYAGKAMQYCVSRSYLIENLWLLGLTYKNLGNMKKALYFFNRCIEFYSANNIPKLLASMMKNKSRLINCPDTAIQAIKILIETRAEQALIDDYYDSLHDIYVNQGDYINAYHAVSKIVDDELRANLKRKLSVALTGSN